MGNGDRGNDLVILHAIDIIISTMKGEPPVVAREITLQLPDNLAREAEANGLLTTESIEALLREEIKRRRVEKLFVAADRLADLDLSPLTEEEMEAEIQAARDERHP